MNREKDKQSAGDNGITISVEEQAAILDNMQELVIYYDADMKIQWANKAACKSLDLNHDEVKGKKCFQVWYGQSEPCEGCPVAAALESGKPEEGEVQTKDGLVWFIKANPMLDEKGKVKGVIEVTLDITNHKKAERKQMKVDALSDILDAMLDPVMVFNVKGKCVYANSACAKMFGRKTSEFIGKPFTKFPNFENQKHEEIMKYMPLFKEALSEGRSGPIELVFIGKDEKEIYVSATGGTIEDANKVTTHLVVLMHDISRRKKIEHELMMKNQALESSVSATVVFNKKRCVTYVNQAFLHLWEYDSIAEVLGKSGNDFWQNKDRIQTIGKTVEEEGVWNGDLMARKKDGKNFKVHLHASIMEDTRGQVWNLSRRH